MYYLQSRYYDPEIGRFINADVLASTGQGLLGNNMFAYCNNNPIMGSDETGTAPEWWQWAASGAMIIGGIAMIATGFGGVVGGALICSGANAMIGSYSSESSGGSSTAGWVGGAITGAISGAGAGIAGELFALATEAVNYACLGYVAASGVTAFASGALGSAVGQGISAQMDGKILDAQNAMGTAALSGTINILCGIGSGMGNAIQNMPLIGTTSTALANALTAGWSVLAEAVCDFMGIVGGFFS